MLRWGMTFAGVAILAIAVSGCLEESGRDNSHPNKASKRSNNGGGGGWGGGSGWAEGGAGGSGYASSDPCAGNGYASSGNCPEDRARQADWENQEGDDWANYLDGYSEGFEAGCDELFDAAGGALYKGNDDWDEYDCERLEEEPEEAPAEVPADPYDEASELGFEAGCAAIFEDEYERVLYTKDGDAITGLDC